MGAVRYRAEFYSQNTIEWKIDLYDSDYAAGVNTFNVKGDGFTISYNGELLGPIVGSEVKINFYIENSDQETLITDIIGAHEERFSVQIYKASVLYWCGFLLTDLVTEEDMFKPFIFVLTATDGFGRLKDIDYDNAGTLYSGTDTFIAHFIKVLSKLNLDSFWGVNDDYLTTAINWYDAHHNSAYTDDPLNLSRFDHEAFQDANKYGTVKGQDCYKVLENLLSIWNARIMQSGGQYYIIQPNEYDASVETRTYKKDGTNKSNDSAAALSTNVFKRLGGGVFTYLKPLNNAFTTYNYKQGQQAGNLLPNPYVFNNTEALGEIQGGSNEKLSLSGDVEIYMKWEDASSPPVIRLFAVYKVILYVGSNYYNNLDGDPVWIANAVKYYEWIVQFKPPVVNGNAITHINHIGFVTPDIPSSETGSFKFEFIEFQDEAGNVVDLSAYSYTYTTTCHNFLLKLYLSDGSTEAGALFFKSLSTVDGTVPVDSKSEKELPETVLGDKPNDYSSGRIQTTDGATWQNAALWKVGAAGTGYNINQLRCHEALAVQRIPTIIYEGSVHENSIHILAVWNLLIDAVCYMLLNGTYTADSDTWSGSWVKIALDRTLISDDSVESELQGSPVEGSYIYQEVIVTYVDSGNQGVESLTAATPVNVTFDNPFDTTDYTITNLWAYTAGGRIVPVKITSKASTGFTVETKETSTYEWIALRI